MKSWCSSLLFRFTNNSGWMLPGIGAARICWRCGSEMWSRFAFIGVLLYRLENMERKLFICARRHEELKERYTSHVTDLGQCCMTCHTQAGPWQPNISKFLLIESELIYQDHLVFLSDPLLFTAHAICCVSPWLFFFTDCYATVFFFSFFPGLRNGV